jgi:hypothetical protein
MYEEPKKFTVTYNLGDLRITMVGERYYPQPIMDTSVNIEGGNICYITWDQKDEFIREINLVIEKYRI